MTVEEIAPGLWRWTAAHPDWTPEEGGSEGWEQEVGCVYYEGPDAIVLIDPLVPGEEDDRERFWRALDRDVERLGLPVAVLLTVFWHGRSAREIVGRYQDARLYARDEERARLDASVTDPFRPGDPLPGGIVPIPAERAYEVVYWIPSHRALVPGDVLLGDGAGGLRLCPAAWLPDGVGLADLADSLAPVLDLPVERVLVAHGEPVLEHARERLADALAAGAR